MCFAVQINELMMLTRLSLMQSNLSSTDGLHFGNFRKCSLLFAACGLHVLLQFATWQTKFALRIVISILQITFSQFTELCNASQIAVNPSHLFCIYMSAHISVAL